MKLVIIINGKGSCGKDTLCQVAAMKFVVRNVSTIDPIRNAMIQHCGYDGGKSEKDRKFLSDVKKIVTAYNDYPTTYLLKHYKEFMDDPLEEIMFCHIREAEEIEKFRSKISSPCITLLVRRDTGIDIYGNESDDNVEDYSYDYIYNSPDIDKLEDDFITFLKNIIKERCN